MSQAFSGYHEMKHNSAITSQNQLEFWKQKAKQGFSLQSKSLGPSVQTLCCKINKEDLRPTSKILPLPIAHHLGHSMYKVLLDSSRYLLSYSTLINPLEPDVHHITSQI